jgi:hypothetical protein
MKLEDIVAKLNKPDLEIKILFKAKRAGGVVAQEVQW